MDDLEQAFDELYAAAPEEFVVERSRLAKALKQKGRTDDAKTIAATRKPSVAAWALNQLSRLSRRETDLLLDAGHRLREAQSDVLAGAGQDAFTRARDAERQALSELTRQAEQLLKTRGSASPAVLNQISQSLRAAAVSQEGRELLAQGRFSEPLKAEGFDLVGELAGSVPPPAAKPRKPPTKQKEMVEEAARKKERLRLSKALREAASDLRAAERSAADARAKAKRLATQAAAAAKKADEAGREAEFAASRVLAAEQQLRSASGGR